MKIRLIIGLFVIAVLIIWGASAFFQTTVQYVTLEQALKSTRTVQVLGRIDFANTVYNTDSLRLELTIYDDNAPNPSDASTLKAVYYGVVPGNFDQATSVVLKGKANDQGVFVAEQMLVKCPSKYQGNSKEEYQDLKKHQGGV
ncbi:MAG: cytochrome c maturation protein CcmE [candidate division Zixibacteria bacterium]|nr:cytochrome c maturation protein CcmE [candidate division Zixibacteria bacterium]MDD5426407.1 cytochrome c maturation protein CcmE [candidate division Zixibacteria bacterium]